MNSLSPLTWNTLFWIIILFTAVNAVTKSFIQISEGRLLYLYTLANPAAIILTKITYNSLLLSGIGLTGFFFYSLILGNPVQNIGLFISSIFLGAIGFSGILSMTSGIASKAANSTALMAILSFPILLPLLLIVIRISRDAIDGLDWMASLSDLIYVSALNVIVITMSYLLFPFLWRS